MYWTKQGTVLDCDVSWTSWVNEDLNRPDEKACRDPMVYKMDNGYWIMYLHTWLFGGHNTGEVVAYAISSDLENWGELEGHIPDTLGYGGSSVESPFLFKVGNDYYLDFKSGNHYLKANDVITQNTSTELVGYSGFEVPHEFLEVYNGDFNKNFLVRSSVDMTSCYRPILFDIIGIDNYMSYYPGSASCSSCNPQPHLIERIGVCDYDQDCNSGLGCANYSSFGLTDTFLENICCENANPSSPGDACCENRYNESSSVPLNLVLSGFQECWEICNGLDSVPNIDNFLLLINDIGYCDVNGFCNCSSWECDLTSEECTFS